MITTGDAAGRRFAVISSSLLVVLLFALRLALAYVREPFFDELFTAWISGKPLFGILSALRLDSGPPLYYFLTHGLGAVFGSSVTAARAVSLACALLSFVLLMRAEWLGEARWAAAILLGVIPAHFYFSAEGRAYSMCALLVGAGVIAIARWEATGGERMLWIGSMAFALAAWTHYYGVLFFPLPFVAAFVGGRSRKTMIRGAAASLACGVAFAPGFWLASIQPVAAATRWMPTDSRDVALSLARLSFAGPFPRSFVVPPPAWLQIATGVAVAGVLVFGALRAPLARQFAAATLLPIVLTFVAELAGRSVYFPFRFESVLAIPFALWIATSMQPIAKPLRSALFVGFLVVGFSICAAVTVQQSQTSDDPYRIAARAIRTRAGVHEPIVASGYSYLEVLSQVDDRWSPPVRSLPASQALHPGWRSEASAAQLASETSSLPADFIWVGEEGSAEERALVAGRRGSLLFRAGPVVVARMTTRK